MDWISLVALGLGGGALIAVVLAAAARRAFLGRIEALQRSLEQAPNASVARTDLPPEVFSLARRLGVSDDGSRRVVRLTQNGEMWLKPGSKPLAFAAQQTFAVAEVGFLWRARFRAMAGVSMQVIDYLVGGKAGLEGRLLGALALVRVTDSDAAFRGEAMRYLAELMWNPDAMLFNTRLDWRVIDPRTLAVATGTGARRSEVRLILDEAGDPVRSEADDRPRLDGGGYIACPWFGRGSDYRTIGGRRTPTQAEAGWIINGVESIYWRGRVESWLLDV